MAFSIVNPVNALWHAQGLHYLIVDKTRLVKPVRKQVRQIKAKQEATKDAKPVLSRPENAWQPVPVQDWPQIWQEQLEQSKKGRIAWTYWQFGEDLLSAKNKIPDPGFLKRRSFLARLLKDLGHPPGTHTFWPARLEQDSEICPDLFWSGLQSLGVRCAVIMGSKAARPLLPNHQPRPLWSSREKNIEVLVLRDLDGFPEAEYQRMLNYLKARLAIYAR